MLKHPLFWLAAHRIESASRPTATCERSVGVVWQARTERGAGNGTGTSATASETETVIGGRSAGLTESAPAGRGRGQERASLRHGPQTPAPGGTPGAGERAASHPSVESIGLCEKRALGFGVALEQTVRVTRCSLLGECRDTALPAGQPASPPALHGCSPSARAAHGASCPSQEGTGSVRFGNSFFRFRPVPELLGSVRPARFGVLFLPGHLAGLPGHPVAAALHHARRSAPGACWFFHLAGRLWCWLPAWPAVRPARRSAGNRAWPSCPLCLLLRLASVSAGPVIFEPPSQGTRVNPPCTSSLTRTSARSQPARQKAGQRGGRPSRQPGSQEAASRHGGAGGSMEQGGAGRSTQEQPGVVRQLASWVGHADDGPHGHWPQSRATLASEFCRGARGCFPASHL